MCFPSTKCIALPLVENFLKTNGRFVLNSKSIDFYFIFLNLRSRTNPYVFVFRFALPTSQIRNKKKKLKQTKYYLTMYTHFISQGIMDTCFSVMTVTPPLLNSSSRNITFITMKLVGFQPQAYIYLSWPIYMTHWAMSYAIFLIKCPVPKHTLQMSVYIKIQYLSEYHPSQWKEFSPKVSFWHLIHDQTKTWSKRKICIIFLHVSQNFLGGVCLLRLSARTKKNTFLLTLH